MNTSTASAGSTAPDPDPVRPPLRERFSRNNAYHLLDSSGAGRPPTPDLMVHSLGKDAGSPQLSPAMQLRTAAAANIRTRGPEPGTRPKQGPVDAALT